ncbi:Ubiquitin fusion degradation protein 1 [Exophiala dermatitidis]
MSYYQGDMIGYPSFMRGAPPVGMSMRRFDEYYRCYPVVMMNGPDRKSVNYGGKVFLPPSALDKLTKLHIAYPMVFELVNGNAGKKTHAGVLEFIAEEGRIYLPQWLMRTLELDPGDLVQIKSTDLPPGKFIKLQPQSPAFLDISDPRAVLENAFRNFSCLTKGDVFTFEYNDQTYDIAVLEIRPDTESHAIVTMETDLEVDFAPPVGYVPPERTSGTSTPRSGVGKPHGGPIHFQGTMAQSINYASIAPSSTTAEAGARAVSSNFLYGGHKLNSKKGSKAPTPNASTPVAGASTNAPAAALPRRGNGPQPLRLPPNKLFFGFEIKPLRKRNENGEPVPPDEVKPRFQGQGQTLRAKKRTAGTDSGVNSDVETKTKGKAGSGGKGRPPS